MPIYRVYTAGFGELLKTADNIGQARAWARAACPGQACPVSRLFELRALCDCCGSRPCDCRRRRKQARGQQ